MYVADMHPRLNESLGWSACMYVGRGIYFRFSSTPLFVRFGPFYSLYLGQVIPACFFSYHFCLCVCLCVCAAVCVAGLFAMVLCRMAGQRLTWRGLGVKRRHSLCSRIRLRRSGWTHHRNILVHPDSSSTCIMNIVYHHSALQYGSIMTLFVCVYVCMYVCTGTSGGSSCKSSCEYSGQAAHRIAIPVLLFYFIL